MFNDTFHTIQDKDRSLEDELDLRTTSYLPLLDFTQVGSVNLSMKHTDQSIDNDGSTGDGQNTTIGT